MHARRSSQILFYQRCCFFSFVFQPLLISHLERKEHSVGQGYVCLSFVVGVVIVIVVIVIVTVVVAIVVVCSFFPTLGRVQEKNIICK